MVKVAPLNDAFSEFFELEASPEESRLLCTAKRLEKEKKERQKKMNLK